SKTTYPLIAGTQPDLYRCFMILAWSNSSEAGVTGLVHPESHFTDLKAGRLRRNAYAHLRRHWQFINKLMLFEISDHVVFGVHIYSTFKVEPNFVTASWLYHPETVERSLIHNGDGLEPGLKTAAGRWDTTAHASRILNVNMGVLQN